MISFDQSSSLLNVTKINLIQYYVQSGAHSTKHSTKMDSNINVNKAYRPEEEEARSSEGALTEKVNSQSESAAALGIDLIGRAQPVMLRSENASRCLA